MNSNSPSLESELSVGRNQFLASPLAVNPPPAALAASQPDNEETMLTREEAIRNYIRDIVPIYYQWLQKLNIGFATQDGLMSNPSVADILRLLFSEEFSDFLKEKEESKQYLDIEVFINAVVIPSMNLTPPLAADLLNSPEFQGYKYRKYFWPRLIAVATSRPAINEPEQLPWPEASQLALTHENT